MQNVIISINCPDEELAKRVQSEIFDYVFETSPSAATEGDLRLDSVVENVVFNQSSVVLSRDQHELVRSVLIEQLNSVDLQIEQVRNGTHVDDELTEEFLTNYKVSVEFTLTAFDRD